jgi:hypothetical protein
MQAYFTATPSQSTPRFFCKCFRLFEPRVLAAQALKFLLRRLHHTGGSEAAVAVSQASRPFAELVWSHIRFAADLRDAHAGGATLVERAHGFALEFVRKGPPLARACLSLSSLSSCCH